MATLLSYGFTATTKSQKKTPEPAQPAQRSQNSSAALRSPPYVRSPESPLPPVPKTAPLSIPRLDAAARHKSRRALSVDASKLSAPGRRDLKVRRPPHPVTTSPDDKFIVSPPMFAATLFPPYNGLSSMSRESSRGLHDSNVRIKKILKTRQIGGLDVNSNHLSPGNPYPRGSISVTPASAYGKQDIPRPSLSLQTNVAPWEQDMALTPIEMDLGALEVIASLPESAHPSRKKSAVKASLRKSMYHPGSRNSVVAFELPGGSLMTVITPEQSAWQRAPYVPSPIRLEPKRKTERSPLAIIQETVNAELGLDKERCAAEQAIVDELVSFVESFGEEFKVEETEIDTFWIDSPPPVPLRINKGYLSPWSNASTLVHSPPATGVPRLSTGSKNLPEDGIDRFGDLKEPDFITKRASFAWSQHSGSSQAVLLTSNSLTTYPSPPVKHPYAAPSPLHSPGMSSMGTPMSGALPTTPRKVRQVKGKGPTSGGSKLSFRALIRSAASIV